MPLPPLPPENTRRYLMAYTVGTQEHHMLARADAAHSDASAVASMQAVAIALKAECANNVNFIALLVAAQGSNVFNPISGWTVQTGAVGAPITDNRRAYEVAISGRSSTGRKSRAYLYGWAGVAPINFEQDPLTAPGLQGWQGLMNSTAGLFLAIDGSKPVWYFRATFNYNDHYERTLRL